VPQGDVFDVFIFVPVQGRDVVGPANRQHGAKRKDEGEALGFHGRIQSFLDFKIRLVDRFLRPPERYLFPNPFMGIIQHDFREKLHTTDRERPFDFARDQIRNDQGVHAAGHTPGDSFHQTTVMFIGHAATR
jgi:hypothetical protein